MIVGDFNTRLPQDEMLSRFWYRGNRFSKRSLMLYDFICDNDLYAVDCGLPECQLYL